jgi:hypothetical protein
MMVAYAIAVMIGTSDRNSYVEGDDDDDDNEDDALITLIMMMMMVL